MNNKFIAILSAAAITIGAVGGVAFANNLKDSSIETTKQKTIQSQVSKTNPVAVEEKEIKADDVAKKISNVNNTNYNRNSANNPSKDIYGDMVRIMRDNGYEDAARYMQTGDYDAMTDYMNNISQEDYDKMIEIMSNNGYGYMGQMMESIGREGMIQMHNSMGAMHGRGTNGRNYNNMMGGY